jgi:glycosyltransferase involved in cell wall biosynthesis
MRIAVFHPRYVPQRPIAASDTIILINQLKELARLGNEIILITEDRKINRSVKGEGICRICPLQGITTKLAWLFSSDYFSPDIILKATKILKKEPADVIYGCGTPFVGMFVTLLGKIVNVPTVYYLTAAFNPSLSALRNIWSTEIVKSYELIKSPFREIARSTPLVIYGLKHTQLIASSYYVRKSLQRLEIDDVPVIYPTVDIPPVNEGFSSYTSPTITYFGHFRRERGVIDLISAFIRLSDEYPGVRLMIGASEIHAETFIEAQKLIRQHGLNSRIIWKGIVNDVYSDLLASSTAVVLPYRTSPSIKLIEAMASARPVITTRVEWTPELVIDGVTGYLVKIGDTNKMARIIKMLINDSERVRIVGERARELIRMKCSSDKTGKAILNVLQKVKYKG